MRTINMTLDIALRIVNWRYDSPYELYNMSQSDGDLAELLNGQYAAVANDADEIVGFYCFGNSAQVPAGHPAGAYQNVSANTVDVGLGMRPDLTGRGLGDTFLAFVLQALDACHPGVNARLSVAAFNRRATRLYERFGFRSTTMFMQGEVPFVVMVRRYEERFHLRRAHVDDAALIGEWLRDPRERLWVTGRDADGEEQFMTWLQIDDQHPFILEQDGRPVAYGEIWIDDEEKDTELAHIIVCAAERERGVGKVLMRMLYRETSYRQYQWTYLRVYPDNETALARFRAWGWEDVADATGVWPQGWIWLKRETELFQR